MEAAAFEDLQWHELRLSMLYPDTDPADFKTREWWERSNDSWHFRFDPAEVAAVEQDTVKKLLIDGMMPILFVDGHVETMSPSEYAEKRFHLMPMNPPN